MSDHICDKALTIEQHGRDLGELFEKANRTAVRVGEVETTLFGAERNGEGYLKAHARKHEEDEVAIKETMQIVQLGMKTISDQQTEQGKKIAKLLDKGRFAREAVKIALAASIPAAASVAAILLSR